MEKHLFLHCGDLHLGCTPNHLEQRYEDFFISFKDLIDNAINFNCKYILISGDLFHLKVINSKTLLNVINLLEYARNNNIKVIAIEGNHDKAFYVDEESWLNFLNEKNYITLLKHKINNGKLIIDNESIYEDDNIRIIGIGYLGSATSIYLKDIQNKISKSKKFTVLMMHAGINRLVGQEMGDISLEQLLPLKGLVDYVALGHIHNKYILEDLFYNPGSIENIRIKDGKRSDDKGYFIVSYQNKQKDVQFIKSKQRAIHNIQIKLENNLQIEEVERYLLNYDYSCEENAILEITICGNVPFNPYLINFDYIKEALIKKYNLLYIDINNLINIVTNEMNLTKIIDIKEIEETAIKDYLTINYPTLENNDEFTKSILTLKDALIDEKEFDQIISLMLEKEDILCD